MLDQTFDPEQKQFWSDHGVRIIESDLRDLGPLEVDAVIHGAALTAEPAELGLTPKAYLKNSLDINLHMLDWSRTSGVRRFIFISSAGVFASTQQGELHEDEPPLSKGLYATAKRATEDLITMLNAEDKWDFTSVRLGNVYGEAEYARRSRPRVSLVQRMLNEAAEKHSISVPNDSERDWTYVGDVASLFVHLLETPSPRELYHFVSDEAFTTRELAQNIKAILPEVELTLSSDPKTQLRAPLKTKYVNDLTFSNWTPFDNGLERVIRARQLLEVAA